MFKILFYCSQELNGSFTELRKIVEKEISSDHIDIIKKFHTLSEKLKDVKNQYNIAILTACNMEELNGLHGWKDCLIHMDIILIVPKNDEKALIYGREFYPRYITEIGRNYGYLSQILHNLIQRSKTREI